MSVDPLPPSRLIRRCDPATLGFATTADLQPVTGMVGQERAGEAVRFAVEMTRDGYNLFALGPEGIGRSTLVRGVLELQAASAPTPPDWVYVHNFARPQEPAALSLPAGRGADLRDRMARLVGELRQAIPAAFETEEYRARREAIEEAARQQRERAIGEFEARAALHEVALVRTPLGVGLTMMREGRVLPPEEFERLPLDEQQRRRADLARLEAELQALLAQLPRWEREKREQIRDLNRRVTEAAVVHLIDEVRAAFADLPQVLAYLDAVQEDVIANAEEFVAAAADQTGGLPAPLRALVGDEGPSFRRYTVNLLVDRRGLQGAPVIYEPNPTYVNLIGRIEHVATLGAMTTNFTLIRSGALHRANGGYLILDARKLLAEPYAWEALKRALRNREIRIEPLGQALGLVTVATLEPQVIPLNVKVALIGDRLLYYLLCALDPDFLELFKVEADFEEEMDRTAEAERLYAGVLATICRREGLRHLNAEAVARVIEYASRRAGDAVKISTHMRSLVDLLEEADRLAARAGREVIGGDDVQAAIYAKIRRASRVKERVQEAIARGVIRIDTAGSVVAQVNGLSVQQLGDLSFGIPSRITASVRLGEGEVVDIEREVELGGPIHSKGVLILSGFLGGRYAPGVPLSLRASLVFEQSYAGVEGDSASLAELCALLSAIGEVPVRQGVAVTGSVDQLGNVQAVGGVNEKIEGFFEVCARRGLDGSQGVIIPAANVAHLMLRDEVVAAVEAGRFHVWAVETVDEALELLTGLEAGRRDEEGRYPEGSVNARVEARLLDLAARAREYAGPPPVVPAPEAGDASREQEGMGGEGS
jgi:lon-related putative ATP-dependent protease